MKTELRKNELKVKDRDIVVPGELLSESTRLIPTSGIYKRNGKLFAERVGMIRIEKNVIKLVPLSGKYLPKKHDKVIGKIVDVLMNGWRLDINSAYSAVLPLKDATNEFIAKDEDLTKYFDIDDYVITKIVNVTSQNLVDVSMRGPGLRKLRGGRIIQVNPTKVPRIIGKEASMIKMLKKSTGCDIQVGQNGWIWLNGDPEKEVLAVKTIRKIEQQAHTQGLTESVEAFLGELKNE